MRTTTLLFALVGVLLCGPARAQGWIEFQDLAWGVGINFPHEPAVKDIEYSGFDETIVPGRVYTVEDGAERYSLTAASFSGEPTDSLTAVSHAAQVLRTKGQVTYDAYHALDGVPGWMMSVTEPDGRLMQAFVLFLDQRLYIAEGSVAPGTPPPSNFQQSITILDPAGGRIQLND